jgi:hypothetical protein
MKRLLLVILALTLLAGMASAGERYLYQVFLKSPGDRALVKPSGFTPYARMKNSIIAEGTKAEVAASGLVCKVLLPAPAKGIFYLVIPPFRKTPQEVRALVAQRCEILAEDRDAFFVRAAQEDAESLLARQFHIVRVGMKPIQLGLSSPILDPPRVAKYDPVIQWIINQITPSEITGMLRDLSGERSTMVRGRQDTIRTRYSLAAKNSSAIFYFYEKASSYAGIDSVRFHPFSWYGYTDSNVVVTKVGRRLPGRQYLIDGHIDSYSENRYVYAPGADDNATGTIASLIAAKVIRQIPFKRTIKCLAFNAEENGLWGSDVYASQAAGRGDTILGVLNGDMIGTNYTHTDSVIAYNANQPGSILLTQRLYEMDTTYHLGVNVIQNTDAPDWSDHYSFWINGYEATSVEEHDFSNVYHTTGDTIGQMDTLYWTKVVKCMVAALCDLAEPDTAFTGMEFPRGGAVEREGFALNVFPNPAPGGAEIYFALPQATEVTLDLYNFSGRRLRRLAQGREEAGNHVLSWHAGEIPAGVYFLRFKAGNESLTQRLILLR